MFKKGLGYKPIENVFRTLFSSTDKKTPSDSAIRLYVMRAGYANLHKPLPEGEWVIIGDVTVDIGTIKCLVTVGVNLEELYEREDFTLSLKDLVIVGIHPTQHATGEFAKESFQADIDRLGGIEKVKAILIDQGPDVKSGGNLLQKVHSRLKIIHDISHKLSLVLEKELKGNPLWEGYTDHLTKSKQCLQQTELAGLQPPKQRSKARFMNTALYINWFEKVQKSKRDGNLNHISEERYNEYFGWMAKYQSFHEHTTQKVGVIETIKDVIRRQGYSSDVYHYLIDLLDAMPLDDSIHPLICNALDVVYEEIEKLDEEQVLPASTEILESLFGSHKNHTARGGHGITGNVLTLGALVGKPPTREEICKIMETTPVLNILRWVKTKVGDTLAKMRDRLLNGEFKGTKFDIISTMAAVA